MKAKTQLKDVKVLVKDGRIINMLIDGDLMRVETVIRNVSNLTHLVLTCLSVYDCNTKKMLIDNSKLLSAYVRGDKK